MPNKYRYDNLDLTGVKVGRLTAIKKIDKSKWLFHCDCGNDVVLSCSRVIGGQKSCGCMRRDCMNNFGKSHISHGESKTKLYRKYRSMLNRCYSPKSHEYERYGKRGITVCEEWKNSYEAFRDWAYNNGYDPNINGGYWSIDRIDNSKGYSPDNCRFTTAKEQMKNRDITTLYDYCGEKYTASEFADIHNIQKTFVYNRAKKGQTLERILYDWERAHSVPNNYVDISEYASMANVTQTTVGRWIRQGKVYAEKFGRKWYILIE